MKKLLPPRHLRIPVAGLVLIAGVVVERNQPVLSNQMAKLQAYSEQPDEHVPTYTWMERSSFTESASPEKIARLRRALGSSSPTLTESVEPTLSLDDPAVDLSTQEPIVDSAQSSALRSEVVAVLPKTTVDGTRIIPKKHPQKDGVYLYGSVPQSGQLGKGYIIFEKQQGKAIGAMYMPDSEFSCFRGAIEPSGTLAMSVRGYPGDFALTQVAANNSIPRLDENETTTYAYSVSLQDYYQLDSVKSQDIDILETCKSAV